MLRTGRFGSTSTLAAGVAAAGHLGQVAPVSAPVGQDLQLSPAAVGLAISLVTLIAAVGAAPAALNTRRWPASRLVVVGLVVLAAVNAFTAMVAHSALVFLLLRALSGVGYLLVVVVGPVLLVQQAGRERSSWVLALWGSCIPAGIAVAAAAGGVSGALLGWRGWFLVVAGATVLSAGAVAITTSTPSAPASLASPQTRTPGQWRRPLYLAGGFCLIASISVVVASLLPSYLHSARGLSPAAAGSVTSLIAIASVPGSIVCGLLLRRGVRPLIIGLAVVGCPFAGAIGIAAPSLAIVIVADVVLVFLSGLGVSALYGALPSVVTNADALPVANGLLVQLGSLGTLLAPPIFAAATGLAHWSLMPLLLAVPVSCGLALFAAAVTRRA